jgi:hypothetical protein
LTKLAVIVSDLHCGSAVGLCPPGLENESGNLIGLNPVQEFLWDCWANRVEPFLDSVCGADKVTLIVNGDCVEGLHHGGKQLISSDLGVHIEAARRVLLKLSARAEAVHLTVGTECHTQNNETARTRSAADRLQRPAAVGAASLLGNVSAVA